MAPVVRPNGDEIKRLRQSRKWNRADLAPKAGCSERTIDKAERGIQIRESTLRGIARALAAPYEKLVLTPEEFESVKARSREMEGEFERIKVRLREMGEDYPLDAFAVTAHNLDVFQIVNRIEADHEEKMTKPREQAGGSGANTIYALKRLGCEVGVAGIVARDRPGQLLKQSLAEAGVRHECLIEVEAKAARGTGRSVVLVEHSTGRRFIGVAPGVNECWAQELRGQNQRGNLLKCIGQTKILHMSSFTNYPERVEQEKLISHLPEQTIVSFTPGALYSRLGCVRLETILRRTNVLFLYEQQLSSLMGIRGRFRFHGDDSDRIKKLEKFFEWRQERGHREPLIVVIKPAIDPIRGVTRPQDLVVACDPSNPINPKASGHIIKRSKDTTGAGDALAAGVLFGLLKGCSLSFCAEAGFQMATLASRKIGARASLPDWEELKEHLGETQQSDD